MTKRKIDWVIPPEAGNRPWPAWRRCWKPMLSRMIPRRPGGCMDEQPIQLLKETRVPIPATKNIRVV